MRPSIAHRTCADARPLQGADTWGQSSGSVTGDRSTWQTVAGCGGNHTGLRVGISYERYTFTRCEEVCERGGGTLARLTDQTAGCRGPELEALLGGGPAYVGLYQTEEGASRPPPPPRLSDALSGWCLTPSRLTKSHRTRMPRRQCLISHVVVG